MLMETSIERAAAEISGQKAPLEFEAGVHPPPDWDLWVSQTTGCVFHQTEWGKVLEKGYQFPSLYAGLREEGRLVFGISGIVFNFKFLKVFFSRVPYGGFLGSSHYLPVFLPLFEKALRKRGIHQIRLTRLGEYPFPDLSGYKETRASQHILDLRGKTAASLWQNYRKNNRRDVSKARRSGVSVRQIAGEHELKTYYGHYERTMKRNDSLCHYTKRLYSDIYRDFILAGKGAFFFADYEGQSIAGSLVIYGKDRDYLIGQVSHPDYLKLCPNDLLYQTMIEKALERRRDFFDFMTTPGGDQRLKFFKEKWGAEEKPFSILEKDLSFLRCRFWRFIWSFLGTKPGRFLVSILKQG